MGQQSLAPPINYITDNSQLSGGAKLLSPTSRDKLECFVNYEATGVLLVNDVLQL